MTAYYNEFDKQKAAWLRNLIEEGVIASGVVDERSIKELQPDDLAGFAQCHFFAGIGVWSLALRRAGWSDDRPVWTGSCPCGPFSVAGKKRGFDDPRHLWPAWFPLIQECRPDVLFGEQSDDAHEWVDLISADLEDIGYAIGTPDIPAGGFRGAHIRQRYYWLADANNAEWWAERAPWNDGHWPATGRVKGHGHAGNGGPDVWLGNAGGDRPNSLFGNTGEVRDLPKAQCEPEHGSALSGGPGDAFGLGDTDPFRLERRTTSHGEMVTLRWPVEERSPRLSGGTGNDWLYCRDAVWRPVESGTCPLVDETPARVGRLRGYGDAIDAETATQFVAAYLDAAPQRARAA